MNFIQVVFTDCLSVITKHIFQKFILYTNYKLLCNLYNYTYYKLVCDLYNSVYTSYTETVQAIYCTIRLYEYKYYSGLFLHIYFWLVNSWIDWMNWFYTLFYLIGYVWIFRSYYPNMGLVFDTYTGPKSVTFPMGLHFLSLASPISQYVKF